MPRKRKPAKDAAKSEASKAAWGERERLKNIQGRIDGARALAAHFRQQEQPEAAIACIEYAYLTAKVNGLQP